MNALVIGGARSGLGVAHLLFQKGYDVTLATNKDFPERSELEGMGIRVVLDDKDMTLVGHYDYVVKNPGIPNTHPLVAKFDRVLNEIDVAAQFAPHYDFYAISGTNGKTTTTILLHDMLRRKNNTALLAGNVGYALSEVVYKEGDSNRDVALEIAAFQMEGTPTFAPKVYGLLNLSPDHLDRFNDDAELYYQAKLSILDRVGTFVRNCDNEAIMRLTEGYLGKVINISLEHEADVCLSGDVVTYFGEKLFTKEDVKVVGQHNLYNITLAAVMALQAGVSRDDIVAAIRDFKGVEHRIEFVEDINGVRYFNDSKATTPESTEVALKAFGQPVILLAGGTDKHVSFNVLKPFANTLKAVYIFGESIPYLKDVFPMAIEVADMYEAFALATEKAVSGDVVLLSPGCASYDQFTDYEQRGAIFKSLVHAYAGKSHI